MMKSVGRNFCNTRLYSKRDRNKTFSTHMSTKCGKKLALECPYLSLCNKDCSPTASVLHNLKIHSSVTADTICDLCSLALHFS